MVTADTFLKTYSKFATKPRSEVEAALTTAADYCPPDQWLAKTDQGITLFAAHLLSMDWWESVALANAAAAQAGGKPAQLPTSVGGNLDADLELTHYGRMFKFQRISIVAMRPQRGPYDAGYLGFSL